MNCFIVEVADDSDQKILDLVLWKERIQAEHLDVVREITEFYYRKVEKGLQVWSLLDGIEVTHAEKKTEGFYFRSFLYHS
jgi:hypothetical protein